MTAFDNFKQLLGLGRVNRDLARSLGADLPDEAIFSVVESEAGEAAQEAKAAEIAKLEQARQQAVAELSAARQETLRVRAERMQAEAAAFAEDLIRACKVYPAEREALIATFAQAAHDDAQIGAVQFADGGTGSRVEQLKAMIEARPAHTLTQPAAEGKLPAQFRVLPGSAGAGQDAEAEAERRRRETLLAMTPQGQAVLAKRAKERGA